MLLFSEKGYDSVSVEQIAGAVGIKAPSLYKHFKNKKDIFDAIFDEMANRFDLFGKTIAANISATDSPKKISEQINPDKIVEKALALFEYSVHDEPTKLFRKLLTIEQFRSDELSDLYSRRYVNLFYDFHTKMFTKLVSSGFITEKIEPEILAMMYDSPLIVLIGECDRHPDREEEFKKKLEAHVRVFFRLVKTDA